MNREALRETIQAAYTEQLVTLPFSTARLQVYVRTAASVWLSFDAGEVADQGGILVTQSRPFDTGFRGSVGGEGIYIASNVKGAIVEVFPWMDQDQVPDSFSDGFSAEFA